VLGAGLLPRGTHLLSEQQRFNSLNGCELMALRRYSIVWAPPPPRRSTRGLLWPTLPEESSYLNGWFMPC